MNNQTLEFAPGERPLYFNNKGLFSDSFLANHLAELEDRKNLDAGLRYLNEYWNSAEYEGHEQFNHVYSQMLQLWDQRKDFLEELNEAQLEEEFIKPIFKLLGWSFVVQDAQTRRGRRNIPDYSMFCSESEIAKARKTKTDEAYNNHLLAVADAKAWSVPLDGIGRSNNNPSYQIVRYMEHTETAWSILTNGRFWRIYSTRSTSKHTTYFEIDLESLLVKRNDERFKFFYNFFRKDGFQKSTTSQQCFLDVVFDEGVYYAKEVEENLKRRVFEVVENIGKGILDGVNSPSEDDLNEAYNFSLYYVFKLMFILNCESKGLLAVDQTGSYYEYSLRCQLVRLKEQYLNSIDWSNQPRTYNFVNDLFSLLSEGDERIGIHGFGQEVFLNEKLFGRKKVKIPDFYLNEAIVHLGCDFDDNDELQFIDYKRLSADHLGSLFEGLLEYRFTVADKKYVVDKGELVEWAGLLDSKKKKLKDTLINCGELFLIKGSGERKNTGAYYTPDYAVRHVVRQCLEEKCESLSIDEMLGLKILDPTMGSGHFLLGVLYEMEELINAKIDENSEKEWFQSENLRQEILESCIRGFDINPLAVELAKFSLWMAVARRDDPLPQLDEIIQVADTLIPRSTSYDSGFNPKESEVYDVIVSNPPWEKLKFDEAEFFSKVSGTALSKKVLKSEKQKVFDRIIDQHQAQDRFASEKKKVEEKIAAVSGEYYQYQANVSEANRSRFIDVNLYKLGMERAIRQLCQGGKLGILVPSGILGDLGSSGLRKFILEDNKLNSIVGFREDADVFKIRQSFCILNVTKGGTTQEFRYLENQMEDYFSRPYEKREVGSILSRETVNIVDDENYTIPYFDDPVGQSITLKAYTYCNSTEKWNLDIGRELHQTDDAKHITNKKGTTRVLKGDEISSFKVRSNAKQWLNAKGEEKYLDRMEARSEKLALRAIANKNLSRRLVATIIPNNIITVNSLLVTKDDLDNDELLFLVAMINSKVLEMRLKQFSKNNNINKYTVNMLPIPKYNKSNIIHSEIVSRTLKCSGDPEKFTDDVEPLIVKMFKLNAGEVKYLNSSIENIADAEEVQSAA